MVKFYNSDSTYSDHVIIQTSLSWTEFLPDIYFNEFCEGTNGLNKSWSEELTYLRERGRRCWLLPRCAFFYSSLLTEPRFCLGQQFSPGKAFTFPESLQLQMVVLPSTGQLDTVDGDKVVFLMKRTRGISQVTWYVVSSCLLLFSQSQRYMCSLEVEGVILEPWGWKPHGQNCGTGN